MTRTPTLLIALWATLALAACGTETTNSGGSTDTAGADTASGDTGGSNDSTGGVDSTGDDSTGGDSTTGDDASGDTADTTPPAKHQTCPALGDCVIAACAPGGFAEGCYTQCIADSSQGAVKLGLPLLGCVQEKCLPTCKDSTEPNCLNDCMGEQCINDLILCISDQPEPTGSKTCMEAAGCFDDCESSGKPPFGCMAGCVAQTDKIGVDALKAVGQCMAQAAKDGKDGEEVCAAEMIGCVTSGKAGEGKCIDFFGCQKACEAQDKSDDTCLFECLPKLTKEAQGQLLAAAPCFENGEGDETCPAKMLACIDPNGTETCVASFGCIGACTQKAGKLEDPATCIFGCIANTSKDEAPLVLGLMQACDDGDKPEPLPGDATPTEDPGPTKECLGAVFACAAPKETGDSCDKVMACTQACEKGDGDGLGCGLGCAAKGAKAEVDKLVKLIGCQQDCNAVCKDSADEQCNGKCILQNCPAEAAACVPKG